MILINSKTKTSQISSMLFSFAFIFQNFAAIFLCVSAYKWDLTSTMSNVRTFANFIDDIYMRYSEANDKMDTIVQNVPVSFPKYQSEKQKRTVFNYTFVKYAAELAHFRVINEEEYVPLKLDHKENRSYRSFVGLLYYHQSLGHQIAEEFEKEIFLPEKQIAKTVIKQIMQLIFSFAMRIQLCVVYHYYFGEFPDVGTWQLNTLLSAFKMLSSQNFNSDENGIFPYQIIQIDENGNHFWAQLLSPNQTVLDYSWEQMQYIENFKFLLRLSEFKLTEYEIYKVLEIIENKTEESERTPAIYTVMKEHFASALSSPSKWPSKIGNKISKMDCALFNFGRMLSNRLMVGVWYFNSKFDESQNECGTNAHIYAAYSNISDNNTPAKGCTQLELELFHEPLWNYVQVIGINTNTSKTLLLLCDDLRNIAHSALSAPSENQYAIYNFIENNQFKIGLEILFWFEPNGENHRKWTNINVNYERKSFSEKTDTLQQFLATLDQIKTDYSSGSSCPFSNQFKLLYYGREISKFGGILYEILKTHWDNVHYDEKRQLLTFPLSACKHIIERLSAFAQRNIVASSTQIPHAFPLSTSKQIIGRLGAYAQGNTASTTRIKHDIDFAKAIQTIASLVDTELRGEKRRKTIAKGINQTLFTLLFSLAIRLCWQIEQNAFFEEYLPTLMSAYGICLINISSQHELFTYKIHVEHEMVQINVPNWKLPYFVYLENENELEVDEVEANLALLDALSKYSPTLYDVLRIAKILDEMHDDHIWVGPSDPKILLFILNFWNKSEKITEQMQISVKHRFCILAHFVMQFLEEAKKAKCLPRIEFVGIFIAQTDELCTEKRIKDEISKLFGEHIANFGKTTRLDLSLNNAVQQVLPPLIDELNKMLQNEKWNYNNLLFVHIVEWKLLEFCLRKSGEGEKWKEIKSLMKKWKRKFNRSFYNENRRQNVQKVVEKMKEKLESLKEVTEENENENDE